MLKSARRAQTRNAEAAKPGAVHGRIPIQSNAAQIHPGKLPGKLLDAGLKSMMTISVASGPNE